MKTETFNVLVAECIEKIRSTLVKKSGEYSRNDDKLHNFKRAGAMLGCTPEKALLGMMVKHTTSIFDMVDDLEKGKFPSLEMLDEKFTDNLNYLILLKALIKESINAEMPYRATVEMKKLEGSK